MSAVVATIEEVAVDVPTLDVLWFSSMNTVVAHDFLVQNFLLAGSLIVVFGESNSGKTFFVLDLALAIAAGLSWRGRRVRRGLVLYVAGEGASSVRNRVAAAKQVNSNLAPGIPFAIIPRAVNLLDQSEVDSLIRTIRSAERDSGEKAALVIFDTLARSLAGGDENSSTDMGLAVSSADRVRIETGAATLLIHHTGKDAAKGARGSNALRCAVDTEVLIEGRSGTRIAKVEKQRDLPVGEEYAFDLRTVTIGQSEDGAITSCVVSAVDAVVGAGRRAPTSKNTKLAFDVIRRQDAEVITLGNLREMLGSVLPDRRRREEAIHWLQENGWLTPTIGGLRVER